MPWSRPRKALVAIAAFTACRSADAPQSDESASVPFDSATAGDTGDADTGKSAEPGEATELCTDAFSISEGKHFGSLRGRQPDLGGACGLGGPDVFFRLDVPRRSDVWLQASGVGIVPRVGVLPHGCAAEWSDRGLACIEGVGAWILDVGAGASLVVSVGVSADDPALVLPSPTEGADPLDFLLDVRLRDVLEVGEGCEPAGRGRCGTGTACLVPDGDASGVAVCTALTADTCATAEGVELDYGTTLVEIPVGALHTDAHAHSCGGARRAERVLALSMPVSDRLEISTSTADVGLALRREDCDPAGELACAPSGPDGARIAVDPPELDAEGPILLLFVELPAGDPGAADDPTGAGTGEEAPIVLQVDLSTPG